MAYNRFSAAFGGVVALYPGTAAADYGGQATIEEAIDRAVDQVAQALPEAVYRALVSPDLERVLTRATAGQTVLPAVARLPIKTGTLHLWRGSPAAFQNRPLLAWESGSGLVERPAADFAPNLASGVITLTTALAADEQVFVSYEADTASVSFVAPSLARMAVRGAAAELGARLYSESNQEWKLVDEYRQAFLQDLEALRSGALVPDEVRAAAYWSEPTPRSGLVGSVRLLRG